MPDDNTNNILNDIVGYNGNDIPEFVELLQSIEDYLCLFEIEDYGGYVEIITDLRSQLMFTRREDDRAIIVEAINRVRELISQQ
jgi:predicted ATP-dependent endonuclease of OLD family